MEVKWMRPGFEALMEKYRLVTDPKASNVIMLGDFGRDLDDESALVLAIGLHRMGIINLYGVVANFAPPLPRARLAKGTLKLLNLPDVPVGVGTDCLKGGAIQAYETPAGYLSDESEVCDGRKLLARLLQGAIDESVILVVNTGLTDVVRLIMDDPDLFRQKVRSVTIMGGVMVNGNEVALDDIGFMLPQIGKNGAYNNNVDEASALFAHRFCQENGIPLTILMRDAAYAVQFPTKTYNRLASTCNPIGVSLSERNIQSMNWLWLRANEPFGSAIRGNLPTRCDRKWFVSVFCGGIDPGVKGNESVAQRVVGFNLYDPLNTLAAIPQTRNMFFDPIKVEVKGTTHRVIGLSKQRSGIREENALRDFVVDTETMVLRSTGNQGNY